MRPGMARREEESPLTRTKAWVLRTSDRYLPGVTRGVAGTPRETIDSKELTLYSRIAAMAIRRPRMIPYLIRASWAFRARDWYRRPPFLPLPPASYMRWRLDTAYGDPAATPPIDEMERYVVWTARMRRRMKGGS